jgi:hypothetical protein
VPIYCYDDFVAHLRSNLKQIFDFERGLNNILMNEPVC